MSTEYDPVLSLIDIEFLRAVRDINQNPADYTGTKAGVAAANTTALRNATSLSPQEIKHRLHEKSDVANEDITLITVYDPPLTDSGFGSKAVELTARGKRVLKHALAKHGLGNHKPTEVSEADRVAGLTRRLEKLEVDIETLQATVDEFEESATGAFGDIQDTQFRAIANAVPRHEQILRALLGESTAEAVNGDDVDDMELLRTIRDRLTEIAREPESSSGS
jgi:hypothetical protein